MNRLSLRPALVGTLMLLAQLAPQCAHAQYSWLDANGTRVFSDRPPPPGIPPSRILKAPRRPDAAPVDAVTGVTPSTAPAPAPTPADKPKPPTLAEREAEYRKR